MAIESWYYLHINGDLIHKRFEPEADSEFVKRVWSLVPSNRAIAWRVILEAAALGARLERLKELSKLWGVVPEDLANYMIHTREEEVNAERKDGLVRMAEEVWMIDLDKLFDNIAEGAKKNV
ncbi:hypothetical protein LCGC14_0483740 [marine sediment metagenome]|uniref:Uncharacterized protein n=1 Tax=marine sediment metagenome TaxID=412755 RepID=A0A0F9VHB9_9ZZZZ